MKRIVIFVAALATATFAAPASAILLSGHPVGIQYVYPYLGTINHDLGSNTVGTDGPTIWPENFSFSFTDTTATASDFTESNGWNPTPFNGFRLYDVNGTIPTFTSVTIDPASNMFGFNASRITFDANNIYVNWNGLNYDVNTVVKLNINSAVPEPANWALMIAGFSLVGAAARRRCTAVAA